MTSVQMETRRFGTTRKKPSRTRGLFSTWHSLPLRATSWCAWLTGEFKTSWWFQKPFKGFPKCHAVNLGVLLFISILYFISFDKFCYKSQLSPTGTNQIHPSTRWTPTLHLCGLKSFPHGLELPCTAGRWLHQWFWPTVTSAKLLDKFILPMSLLNLNLLFFILGKLNER